MDEKLTQQLMHIKDNGIYVFSPLIQTHLFDMTSTNMLKYTS